MRKRFLLDIFLVRELIDLRWTFRDTLRCTFVSLGQKTVLLDAFVSSNQMENSCVKWMALPHQGLWYAGDAGDEPGLLPNHYMMLPNGA